MALSKYQCLAIMLIEEDEAEFVCRKLFTNRINIQPETDSGGEGQK